MVRSLLNGRKTQTRRVVKGTALKWLQPGMSVPAYVANPENNLCPYGRLDDRLWVREAWRVIDVADCFAPREITAASRIWYEADAPHQPGFGKCRPPMLMPRWASRITLEITGVRVERLQDISEADSVAEGCTKNHNGYFWGGPHDVSGLKQMATAKQAYRDLWESINGPGSWEANPWVWVVSFKHLEGSNP
jgi:hypothetical protein